MVLVNTDYGFIKSPHSTKQASIYMQYQCLVLYMIVWMRWLPCVLYIYKECYAEDMDPILTRATGDSQLLSREIHPWSPKTAKDAISPWSLLLIAIIMFDDLFWRCLFIMWHSSHVYRYGCCYHDCHYCISIITLFFSWDKFFQIPMPIFSVLLLVLIMFHHQSSIYTVCQGTEQRNETKLKHVFARWIHVWYVLGSRYIVSLKLR